jgi:DNA-binding MarR family transcriptional regulator
MDRTTLTAALKTLRRRGLIKITTNRDDQRARLLMLTLQGKKLLASAVPVWMSTGAAVETRFDASERNRLRKNLRMIS